MSDYDGIDEQDTLLEGGEGQNQALSPTLVAPAVSAGNRPDAILQALALAQRTGSQGPAAPSYAADVAQSRSRVAKILADSLKGLEGTSGLERVANAAMQTLAGQGRINFPQAMGAMESQDLGRAVNIANALSGLSRAEGAGQMSTKDILQLVRRQTEAAARSGNAEAQLLEKSVRGLSNKYADPAAASAAAYEYAVKWKEQNPNATINDFNRLASGMSQHVSSLRLKLARQPGGEGAAPDRGGIVVDENDNVTQRKLWVPSKGEPLSDIEKKMNLALRSGNNAEYDRLYFDNQATLASKAVRDQLGPEGTKALARVRDAHRTAVGAFDLFAQIEKNLDEDPNVTGRAGDVASFVGGVAGFLGQMRNQVGNILNATVAAGGPEADGARRAQAALTNPESSEYIGPALNRAINSPTIKALIDQGANADVLKANIVSLAYVNAAANDASGRFSDRDVAAGMAQAAAQASNPTSMRRAMGELRTRYTNNMNALLRSAPVFSEREVSWSPALNIGAQVDQILRPVRGAASRRVAQPAAPATVPAPTPTPAPATPASTTPTPRRFTQEQANEARNRAKSAIAAGANRDEVIKRLQENGISTEGL